MKTPDFFKALLSQQGRDTNKLSLEKLPFEFLPANEVVIQVQYSSLNYKDA